MSHFYSQTDYFSPSSWLYFFFFRGLRFGRPLLLGAAFQTTLRITPRTYITPIGPRFFRIPASGCGLVIEDSVKRRSKLQFNGLLYQLFSGQSAYGRGRAILRNSHCWQESSIKFNQVDACTWGKTGALAFHIPWTNNQRLRQHSMQGSFFTNR